jgi:hypothetical protein
MVIKKGDQIQPFEAAFPQKTVVKVVAVDIDHRAQKASPEMTKPPEGGLSPQEHPAKPGGRGVSRGEIIHDPAFRQQDLFALPVAC